MKTQKSIAVAGILAILGLAFIGCAEPTAAVGGSPDTNKNPGATVATPTLRSKTDTSITINTVAAPGNGQTVEYAIGTNPNASDSGWQDGLSFGGLNAETAYYIFARSKENNAYYAGTPSALQVTTDQDPQDPDKSTGAEVSAPTLASKTDTIITINAVTAPSNGQSVEYAISTGSAAPSSDWQDGLTFSGLTAENTYYIFARSKENDTHNAGTPSAGLEVTTDSASLKIIVTNTDEWNAALTTIRTGGNGTTGTPKTYTITVSGDVLVSGATTNSFGTVSNIAVTINGNGKLYIIGRGSAINITNNQIVYIDSEDLILEGLKNGQNGSTLDNNRAVVYMTGGTLELLNGTIRGNTGGSGVYVSGGTTTIGNFTMSGGTISGNTGGSGVYVSNTGTMICSFTMSGGTISGNTAGSNGGGGVYVASNGTFTISGGTVYGIDADPALANTASSNGAALYASGTAKYGNGIDILPYTDGESLYTNYTVTVDTAFPDTNLAAQLTWLQYNAVSGNDYILEVNDAESLRPYTLSYSGRDDITITLKGTGANRTVSLSSNGSMFTIGSGVTLVLDSNITLQGRSGNTTSLVQVRGTLVMKDGSKITGNTTSSSGGGVYVDDSGTFTMEGGEISGNTATNRGGGVYVVANASFTMSGGTVYGVDADLAFRNIASSSGAALYLASNGTAVYDDGSNILPYTDGQPLYTNYTLVVGTAFPDTGLAAKLAWLQSNAASGGNYTLEVNADEPIGSYTLSYSGRNNITITLKGTGANRTISLSSNGSMFTVGSGVTLVLDSNITLQGRSGNTTSLVRVNEGGMLVMKDGSKISGNTNTVSGSTSSSSSVSSYGGGVYVADSGIFTMEGGEISGNRASASSNTSYWTADIRTSSYGGGVYVGSNGNFTMSGGEISGNTASASASSTNIYSSTSSSAVGGGVYVVSNGTFTMSGGEISGNTASASASSPNSSSSSSAGGGVYNGGTFRITNGVIYGSGEGQNSNAATNGAALYGNSSGAQHGTFVNGIWTSRGNLTTTNNNTIRVVEGELQP